LALVLGAAGLGACGGKVVKAQATPGAGVVIALDGDEKRSHRWVVDPGQHQVDVTWPDGTRVTELIEVRRDIMLVLNRDGRPGTVEGIDQPKPGEKAEGEEGDGTSDEPADVAPVELTPEQAFAQAKELFQEGKKAFELAEFDAAIENFKEAFALLADADSPDYEPIKAQVAYNLAVVYERSYDVTPEVERLRRARAMFQNYDSMQSRVDEKWVGSPEQEELRLHLQEIAARIAKIEGRD
jgi:hypothetical protein